MNTVTTHAGRPPVCPCGSAVDLVGSDGPVGYGDCPACERLVAVVVVAREEPPLFDAGPFDDVAEPALF